MSDYTPARILPSLVTVPALRVYNDRIKPHVAKKTAPGKEVIRTLVSDFRKAAKDTNNRERGSKEK